MKSLKVLYIINNLNKTSNIKQTKQMAESISSMIDDIVIAWREMECIESSEDEYIVSIFHDMENNIDEIADNLVYKIYGDIYTKICRNKASFGNYPNFISDIQTLKNAVSVFI